MAKKPKQEATPTTRPHAGSTMSRYISFVMLVVTILVCGFFFFNVIKGFLLPLFLASLLAVIFRPVHEWMSGKCKHRPALSAALSTSAIMLVVLVPLAGLVTLGLYEANQVVRSRDTFVAKFNDVRALLGMQKPFAARLDVIETELRKLDDAFGEASNADEPYLTSLLQNSRSTIQEELRLLKLDGRATVTDLVTDFEIEARTRATGLLAESQPIERELEQLYMQKRLLEKDSEADLPPQNATQSQIDDLEAKRADVSERVAEFGAAFPDGLVAYQALKLKSQLIGQLGVAPEGMITDSDRPTPEKRSLRYVLSRSSKQPELGFVESIGSFSSKLNAIPPTNESVGDAQSDARAIPSSLARRRAFTDMQLEYDELNTALLSGPIRKRVIELVNPSDDQLHELVSKLFSGGATRWLPSITNTATSLITGLLMGLGIMAIALFYFFMDGPKMINTFMHLSPLDDRHEMELLQEFDKVSRAVVLATLLSAVAQGILGGIGYKIVGLQSVFLLTLLTTVLSLIPFVGAAAIWLPCCLYIAVIKESPDPEGVRTWMYVKAGFLAVYGFGIISMADNVIKPWVLQGQSKLHPLLALLSVLGGVQALGPIGILVGPMVVAFLQVLLTILQREITSLDEEMRAAGDTAPSSGHQAELPSTTPSNTREDAT